MSSDSSRTQVPAKPHRSDIESPFSMPTNLPQRPYVEVPPFPASGFDHPDVRAEWDRAHRVVAEARFRLDPDVLRQYAEAQLAREKWHSKQRGRKPSGDLRHPVARDRLQWIARDMVRDHERSLSGSERTIQAIVTGDVVRVEYFDAALGDDHSPQVPVLVLQSDLNREAERKRARTNRTPEQVATDEAKWDEMVEEMLADLPDREPELPIPNLPELPSDRDPTTSEVAALDYAIRKHLRYLERGEQIEAKRKKDAATKVRTAAKRDAEQANPEGTAAGKKAVQMSKAAERQRRWRERKKAGKDG